jgi:hypothetical protein
VAASELQHLCEIEQCLRPAVESVGLRREGDSLACETLGLGERLPAREQLRLDCPP